jgi:hypothetical protein
MENISCLTFDLRAQTLENKTLSSLTLPVSVWKEQQWQTQ